MALSDVRALWVLTPDNDPREKEIWEFLYEAEYPRPEDARSIERAA